MAASPRITLRGPSRVSWPGAMLALVWIALAVCLPALAARDGSHDSWRVIERSGVVRIGIANEPPYGYVDTDSGRATGEAPEVARAVFARMGIDRVEVITTEFRALIPALRAGRFDVIAAGMYITTDRCKQVLFSDPTYRIGEGFLVRTGNPKQLRAYAHVAARQDAVLGVVGGSVELGYAKRLGVPRDRIAMLKDTSAAVDSLKAGHIDAFAGTALTLRRLLTRAADPSLEIAEPFAQPVIDGREVWGYGAFAFRQGDRRLYDRFNTELHGFLGSAEHRELVRPFGFGDGQMPRDVTAAALCAGES